MPIAHCIVDPERVPRDGDPVARWARESGQSAEHMTIELIPRLRQFGHAYAAMATLYLPSMWSAEAVDALQAGLARALAGYLGVAVGEVQVITRVVEPGQVVEDGEVLRW